MEVKQENGGRRSVQVEVDVPGSIDTVWQAIATGPGISSWFVPTEMDYEGDAPVAVRYQFGPGIAPRSPITVWQPPHYFAAQGEAWGAAPPVTCEWRISDNADGTCRVSVVNAMRSETGEFDALLASTAQGWPGFFRILRVVLTHFAGQSSAIMQLVAPVQGTQEQAWSALKGAMGLHGVTPGQPWSAPHDAPPLAGVAEYMSDHPGDALLRIDTPGPGAAAFGAFNYGGQSMVAMNLYHYGEQAQAMVDRERGRWQAWLDARLAAAPARDAA